MCQTNCWYDKIWVVHQEIVWSTHNIDTGMKENLTKLKEIDTGMKENLTKLKEKSQETWIHIKCISTGQ